jgi:hypothetical protein
MMAKKEEAIVKRGRSGAERKVHTCATVIDLTNQALQLQKLDVKAKLLAKESRIMLTDLSVIDADQRAWFDKKRAIILQRDA